MKSYATLIAVNLKLAMRERIAIFFNYIFPLILFFIFGQSLHADRGGVAMQVVTIVLIIGVLGNGLFGGGVRTVQDREQNILRRFKVAPISPVPILVASMTTGWILYVPTVILTLILAKFVYGMPFPERWESLLILMSIAVIAFRAIGLIVASVANSSQESQILVQLIYLSMLVTSIGFSLGSVPGWLEIAGRFLPASYLVTGVQSIIFRNEGLVDNWSVIAALALTIGLSTLISVKLFRWEKDEKIKGTAKLWLLAITIPFIVLGAYQAYSRDESAKARSIYRHVQRSRTLLIRGGRVFVGNGKVIESGAVLVENGKIAGVFEGAAPQVPNAEVIDAYGKTVLPGFIDASVHLISPGAPYDPPTAYTPERAMLHELTAHLYCGVTAVRTSGDPLALDVKLRDRTESGELLGSQVLISGLLPADAADLPFLNTLPPTVEAATGRELNSTAAPGASLEGSLDYFKRSGFYSVDISGKGAARIGPAAELARQRGLRVIAYVRTLDELSAAIAARVTAVAGSLIEPVPESLLASMARERVAYIPSLASVASQLDLQGRNPARLASSLLEQAGPPALIRGAAVFLKSAPPPNIGSNALEVAQSNASRAFRAGVMLVTGSGAGNPLVFHGPGMHRELKLLVDSGVPAAAVLSAATANASRLLGTSELAGSIRKGSYADLVIVDGNPLEDLSATERISAVIFRGEQIDRAELFDQE